MVTVEMLAASLKDADPKAYVALWDWNGGDEKHNYVQPILDPNRYEGVFMLSKDLPCRGDMKNE
jgi:hypothetical protein